MKQTTKSTSAELKLADISLSPFNYRFAGTQSDDSMLHELAASIKIHGVIQAVLVRPIKAGKYELVTGERRYRASGIAAKQSIPAIIRELNDDQVKEIQLIENLQRENPHPMAEAIGFKQLQSLSGKKTSLEAIADRIGKSVSYVYQRMKLNDLDESFRQLFFADKINTSQALKIARLDSNSQQDFFDSYCKNWKEENWTLHHFNSRIENYQLELGDAPFDIKNAKLDKKAGACTKCPNNTAVATSLFPDESADARCTNRPCYENKCRLHARLQLAALFTEYPDLPLAVPDDTVITDLFTEDDSLIKGRTLLMDAIDYFDYYSLPRQPKREEFDYNDSEEENEEEYQVAVQQYDSEVLQLQQEVTDGNYRMAILLEREGEPEVVYLDTRNQRPAGSSPSIEIKTEFRAKDYQEAIRTQSLTAEIITQERDRLMFREKRSKELDEIRLQESFYRALEENEKAFSSDYPAGINDRAVSVFILYDSLNYHWKNRFTTEVLERSVSRKDEEDKLMHFFFNATENEVSVLCRMALLHKAEAKLPESKAGQLLRLIVEGTDGMDAGELINIQQTVTREREMKLEEKLELLNRQAEKLQ